ncbi:MAG: response regulator, partial [Chitinispirillaceae bacterium]|nr:response regulator [Chitinispirillaceae bacterium]
TTKQKGSGLGLAVAYSIVRRHDGLIEAQSQLGNGTVIHIYLPASDNKAAPERHTASSGKRRGGVRVLVMDDEMFIRDIAVTILARMGYEADTAACGEEAVEKFSQAEEEGRPYLLAVLDLTIAGGMGGKETNRELKKISPGVKSIVSSGYYDDPVMAHPGEHGFDASMRKPYRIEEMEEVVNCVMSDCSPPAIPP